MALGERPPVPIAVDFDVDRKIHGKVGVNPRGEADA